MSRPPIRVYDGKLFERQLKETLDYLEGVGGGGGGAATWGSIFGDVADQTDLFALFAGKSDVSHIHVTGDITGLAEFIRDTIAAALVAGPNVTITPNDPGDTIQIGASGGGGGAADTYETVAQNLDAADATFGYDGSGNLVTVTYSNGIAKTIAYSGGLPSTITLSGATPGGIDLVKTLGYSGGDLASVAYS